MTFVHMTLDFISAIRSLTSLETLTGFFLSAESIVIVSIQFTDDCYTVLKDS
jgi:hypothetical protein